jgi:hypothetical protein
MSPLTRLRAFLNRFKHQVHATSLAPPQVPALLTDIEGGETNLLPFSATQQPLRVCFTPWQDSDPSPDDPEQLTLYWDDQPVDSKTWTDPIPADQLFVMLPERHLLVEGEHQLHYTVQLYNGNASSSPPLTLTIDRTPPRLADDSSLIFEHEVISAGVTDAYLQTHGDQLSATVPEYQSIKPGDVLTWYWSTTPAGTDEVDRWTLALGDVSRPLRISIPGEFIRNLGDGIRYARYTVQDRAGTALQRSFPMVLQCNATPLPTRFSPPYLKETGSMGASSTLDPARALTGATLVIKPENSFEPDDVVEVFWGVPGEHGAYSTSEPITPGGREYAIPKANVSARLASQLVMYFEVTRRGVIHASDSHDLTVQAPRNLPSPQCDKINGNYLSLGAVGTGATFTLMAWQHRTTSQLVTMYVTGKRKDGSRDPVIVGESVPVPSPSGSMTVGTLRRQNLEVFEVPTSLEIIASFSVDGGNSWIKFPHSAATLVS